jgi:hypothetical protein
MPPTPEELLARLPLLRQLASLLSMPAGATFTNTYVHIWVWRPAHWLGVFTLPRPLPRAIREIDRCATGISQLVRFHLAMWEWLHEAD